MSFVDGKKRDAITEAVHVATERIIYHRHAVIGARVDRITEKLKMARDVVARAQQSLENEADKLIAREAVIAQRAADAFRPHHSLLDSRHRELDQLEDALKIVSNADPLDGSEDDSGTEEGGDDVT